MDFCDHKQQHPKNTILHNVECMKIQQVENICTESVNKAMNKKGKRSNSPKVKKRS